MAVYTPLTDVALAEIASAFGLGAVRQAVGIPQGSINTNYRLDTDQGRFFLRLTTVRSADELTFESALLSYLAEGRFPAPKPLPTRAGAPFLEHSGGRVSVFQFLVGEELTRAAFSPVHAQRLGAELGRMHQLTAAFLPTRPNPYGLACIRAWRDGLKGHSDGEVVRALDVTSPVLEAFGGRGEGLLPRGAIHADLFMDNVKWLGDRVSAFFDFEMACTDAYVLDLAVTLNAWCFEGEYQRAQCHALLEGYQSERPLSEVERAGFHEQALFGACRFTLSRIRDFHLSPLPPERLVRKDFRTYLARVKALTQMGAHGFRTLVGV